MRVVMVGPFGLSPRMTMSVRALSMGQALTARGHSVTILLPPWQNPEDEGVRKEVGGVIIENIHLPHRLPGLFHLLTALRLARRAMALQPDVVHLFKPKAYSGLAHWLLCRLPRRRRPRLVVDTDDWEGPGGWNDLAPYTAAQRRFFAWQERWGLTHAGAVTVASRALQSMVLSLGASPQCVFYVPNGVSPHQPERPGTQPAPPSPTLLLYTRFFEFSISRVIEVLRSVRQQIPEARLMVVGKGLFGEEQELLQEAQRADLDDAVEYVGWVEPEKLPETLTRADLAIYPFDDTLINRTKCSAKLVELLALGIPVVAESVGQNREFIRHGETGWLVEPGDPATFAQAVVRLLEDATLCRQLGQAAAQDVRERFAWERMITTVEAAYEAASQQRC